MAYLETEDFLKACRQFEMICIFRALAFLEQFIEAFSRMFSIIHGY